MASSLEASHQSNSTSNTNHDWNMKAIYAQLTTDKRARDQTSANLCTVDNVFAFHCSTLSTSQAFHALVNRSASSPTPNELALLSLLILCPQLSSCVVSQYRSSLAVIITQSFEAISDFLSANDRSAHTASLLATYPLLQQHQHKHKRELWLRVMEDALSNALPSLTPIACIRNAYEIGFVSAM